MATSSLCFMCRGHSAPRGLFASHSFHAQPVRGTLAGRLEVAAVAGVAVAAVAAVAVAVVVAVAVARLW